MKHLTLTGEHYQMGACRGEVFRRDKVSFPLHLDDFQLAHGRESEKLLQNFYPEVCEEIRGVCDAMGLAYLPFASWLLCMGCCMYHLEANIPVEIRGCTAFACQTDGRMIYGRNNDLPPFLRDGCRSEIYVPAEGNRFQITTSSFINGEEGLNEYGLAVAMTFVMTASEKIRPGLNACFLVRYLLEKARHTKEALSLLTALPVSSNCNILLADCKGEMAVVECTPSAKRIREPVRSGSGHGSIVCAVNSFISGEMKPYDDAAGNDYGASRRYKVVMDSFEAHIRGDLIETVERLLRGEYGFMCQYDEEPDFETVWSSVFDLDTRMVYRAEGDPRNHGFHADDRLCRLQRGE